MVYLFYLDLNLQIDQQHVHYSHQQLHQYYFQFYHFDYNHTTLIIKETHDNTASNKLAKILTINDKNIIKDKNMTWDFKIIIGKDYKTLKSFETIQKFYTIF